MVYNSVDTIENAIESVINQTYQNFQLIIIDGNSKDGTLDIINKYDEYLDYWESKNDKGIYDAMNKGLDHVKGQFVYFLGADDILFNNQVLETVSKFLKEHQTTIYYGNVLFKSSNKIYDGKFNALKLVTRNISHQCIFYPYTLLKEYRFNTKYKVFADYNLNLLLYSKFKFIYINKLIAVFNEQGMSGSRTKDIEFEKNRNKIIKNNYSFLVYYYRISRSFIKKYFNE